MGMTPEDFFVGFVEKNYEDFKDNPGCVRRAFNAAVAATSMADHYYKHTNPNITKKCLNNYKKDISKKTSGAFNDIRSIANAYKHLYVGNDTNSTISSAGVIEIIHVDQEDENIETISSVDEMRDDNPIVRYTTKDGRQHIFIDTLEKVFNFWSNLIHNQNAKTN